MAGAPAEACYDPAQFHSSAAIRELRDLTRRRKRVLGAATSEKNRVQKVLEDANVKLGNVLSDIFGVSGQLMLEALLKGEAQPEEIAQFAKRRAQRKIPEITAALQGHRMSDHHRQMLRYSLDHLRFLEKHLEELDRDIVAKIREAGLEPQWKLVQSVPGVAESSAATILAETGTDMQQFPDAGHFSSWVGVCPGNNRSADKNKSSHTTGGNPWLCSVMTQCAWAAAAKKSSYWKEQFWRLTASHAGKKAPAVVAVSHMLLIRIYHVLASGKPYEEKQPPPLTEPQKARMIRHHVRRLGKLGIAVYSSRPEPTGKRRRSCRATGQASAS